MTNDKQTFVGAEAPGDATGAGHRYLEALRAYGKKVGCRKCQAQVAAGRERCSYCGLVFNDKPGRIDLT